LASFATAIIGGGVTGIALARELARRGQRRIVLFEKESAVAHHSSGRNSGVVHAGYNPKPGSLKAKLCVEGNRLLKEFCRKHGVPLVEGGILIVATNPSEAERLPELARRGEESGVEGMRLLDPAGLRRIEPEALGVAALHSPSGASVDASLYVAALAEEARSLGVEIRLASRVSVVERRGGEFVIHHGGERTTAGRLVNCAGLHADRIAHSLGAGDDYAIIPVRGEYKLLRAERAGIIRSMIYPVPNLAFPFLGVHWTKTASGEVKIGPNAVPALGREAYSWGQSTIRGAAELAMEPRAWRLLGQTGFARLISDQTMISLSPRRFLAAARRLVKSVRAEDILPGPAGIRAQLVDRSGRLVEDLVVEERDDALHVLNVVSPGLTCSLAFAAHLADKI